VRVASILGIAGMVSFGCAPHRVDLVERNKLLVRRIPSTNIYVSRVFVYQVGDELEISGRVKRRRDAIPTGGHVDIALVHPDGRILERVSVPYSPRIIRRRWAQESFFQVRLSPIPPEGTTIYTTYHAFRGSQGGRFDCGDNAAIPGD